MGARTSPVDTRNEGKCCLNWWVEIHVCTCRCQGKRRHKPCEVLDPSCQYDNPEVGRFGILFGGIFYMDWTVISLPFAVSGQHYPDILDEHVISLVREHYPTGNLFLQQDNAPCHRSRFVSEWLNEHTKYTNLFLCQLVHLTSIPSSRCGWHVKGYSSL